MLGGGKDSFVSGIAINHEKRFGPTFGVISYRRSKIEKWNSSNRWICGLEAVVFAMPSEMGFVGPVIAVGRKDDAHFCFRCQKQLIYTRLVKAFRINQYAVIIVQRPEPFVEHPMCILAKRYAVTGMIVTAISKLVNMRCFYDASAADSYESVPSEGTSVIIGGKDG